MAPGRLLRHLPSVSLGVALGHDERDFPPRVLRATGGSSLPTSPVIIARRVIARRTVGVAVRIDDYWRRRWRVVSDRRRSIDHRWRSVDHGWRSIDDGRLRHVDHRRLRDDHGMDAKAAEELVEDGEGTEPQRGIG